MPEEKCPYPQHQMCMEEAGWCPVCNEGDLDPAWAARHGVDLET